MHYVQHGAGVERDGRGAALQAQRLAGHRARGFGKHDQRLAARQRGVAVAQQLLRVAVRNVARRADRERNEWIPKKRVLHYTAGLRDVGEQHHDVEQRRVVRDDHVAALGETCQRFRLDVETDHAGRIEEAEKQSIARTNDGARGTPAYRRARHQRERREP